MSDFLWTTFWKRNKKDVISSSNIDLWKVEIEETNENREKLVNTEINIGEVFRGDTTKLAKKIFSVKPLDKHIYIIIMQSPLSANSKYLPIVYLSNRKFALSHVL